MRSGSLVAVIVHQGKVIVPFGDDMINKDDHVVIISCDSGIGDLNEVIYQ
jgi:trk system potassium uptake protein TrkA